MAIDKDVISCDIFHGNWVLNDDLVLIMNLGLAHLSMILLTASRLELEVELAEVMLLLTAPL